MVGVVDNANTVLACELAGKLDGVFYCLCTRVGEHDALVVVTGSVLDELLSYCHITFVGGHGEAQVGVVTGLLSYSGNDTVVAVSHCGHTNTCGKVDELVAVHINHDGAVCVLNEHGKCGTHTCRNDSVTSLHHFL